MVIQPYDSDNPFGHFIELRHLSVHSSTDLFGCGGSSHRKWQRPEFLTFLSKHVIS